METFKKLLISALMIASPLMYVGSANATPVVYDFTAKAAGGSLNGSVFTGSFTVDSTSVTAGSGAVSNLAFSLLGSTITGAAAAFGQTPQAQFALDGTFKGLFNFTVLSTARANFCCGGVSGVVLPSPVSSFFFSSGGFGYGTNPADGETFLNGAVSGAVHTATPVPEPFSLSIFAAGLAGIVISRRRSAI